MRTWSTPPPAATGLGVLQAAADKGKLSIGVDSNQNYLHPGSVLTSMMKRVDVAVHDAFTDGQGRQLEAGHARAWACKENGVDYALDDDNRPVLTPEIAGQDRRGQAGRSSRGKLVVKPYEQ